MSIIKFNKRLDFGTDYYVQVLNIRKWSLLQVSVSWNDYAATPYLQITFGSNGFFSILSWVYKFGFDVDILSRTWNFDYMNYKEWRYNRLCMKHLGMKPTKMYVSKEDYDELVRRINEKPDPKVMERFREIMSRRSPWDD
jgi:hypothetical protein